MLLDKKKVGMVTKVGAVIIALAFIVVYIPMISQIIPGSGGDQTSSQPQTDAQVAATIAAFEQAAQKNPKDANAWIKLGNAYGDQKIYDKAIESYSKALELDPKNVNVRIDRAISYFYSGQIETATVEAKKGIEIDPKHANAYFNLGVFLNSQGKSQEAIAAYKKYIELDPNGEGAKQAKEQLKVLVEKTKESTTQAEGSNAN